jgi:hypothetical protein
VKKPEIGCLMGNDLGPVMVPFSRQNASLTPKALRVQQLRGQGKSFDEAFAIADREYTSDGLTLKPEAAIASGVKHNSILASGVVKMGEVQI